MRVVAVTVWLCVGAASAAAEPKAASQVLARGVRQVEAAQGVVVVRRARGGAAPVVLGKIRPRSKLSARVGRFLGRADLLDVTVVETAEQGWHSSRREVHYVLDVSGQTDVAVCTFEGASGSYGEYASSVTTITVKRTAGAPLAFDVERTTRSRASQPKPPPPDSTTSVVEHYELGASACTPGPPG